jgi:hypothetical protein
MSIIVIEDIDCSLDLTANQRFKKKNRPYHKDRKVTLSGLFNFIDGLWPGLVLTAMGERSRDLAHR